MIILTTIAGCFLLPGESSEEGDDEPILEVDPNQPDIHTTGTPQVAATPPNGSQPDPTGTPTPQPEPENTWTPIVPTRSLVSAPQWPPPSVNPDQCDDITMGAPVLEDGCLTGVLNCGDRVVGHTLGGSDQYDSVFYEKKFCWPRTMDHDSGDERVYRLNVPAGEWRAWVTLYSPCADLSLAAMRHDGDSCPTMRDTVKVCEMSVREGRMTERVELTTQTRNGHEPSWYVAVEGPDDNEGLYELVVQCAPGIAGPVAD